MGAPNVVHRNSHPGGNYSCDWCGQMPYVTFEYPEASGVGRWFCNRDCAESFAGGWPSDAFGRLRIQTPS
jgi:hypothetical protein